MTKMTVSEYKKEKRKTKSLSTEFMANLTIFGADLKVSVKPEYKFHPVRRWRFDFAWPEQRVAVECDGMVWQAGGGRHNKDPDREKINTAISMGWAVLRFSGNQIKSDPMGCLELLSQTMRFRECENG